MWITSMGIHGAGVLVVLVIPPASTKLIEGYTGITLSVCPSVCITQKCVTIYTYKNNSCDNLDSVTGLCDCKCSDASKVHFCDVKIGFILCDCLFLLHVQIFVAWLFGHATQMDRLHLRHVPCRGQFQKLQFSYLPPEKHRKGAIFGQSHK